MNTNITQKKKLRVVLKAHIEKIVSKASESWGRGGRSKSLCSFSRPTALPIHKCLKVFFSSPILLFWQHIIFVPNHQSGKYKMKFLYDSITNGNMRGCLSMNGLFEMKTPLHVEEPRPWELPTVHTAPGTGFWALVRIGSLEGPAASRAYAWTAAQSLVLLVGIRCRQLKESALLAVEISLCVFLFPQENSYLTEQQAFCAFQCP